MSPRDRNKSAEPSPRPIQALSEGAPASDVSVPTVVTNSSFSQEDTKNATEELPAEKPVEETKEISLPEPKAPLNSAKVEVLSSEPALPVPEMPSTP